MVLSDCKHLRIFVDFKSFLICKNPVKANKTSLEKRKRVDKTIITNSNALYII